VHVIEPLGRIICRDLNEPTEVVCQYTQAYSAKIYQGLGC